MSKLNLEVIDLDKISEEEKKKIQEDLENLGRKRKGAIKGEKIILAKKGQEIVGFTSLLPQKNSIFIDKVKVKEKVRGKGVGTKMNEQVEKQAEKQDAERIHGKVPKEKARKFWRGKGYKIKEKDVGQIEKKKKKKKKNKKR